VPRKYVSIDGVATFVQHTGATTLPDVAPDLSRGDTVVCLHGAGGNGGLFSDLLGALVESHSPLSFDQPGHGRSGGLDSLGSVERMSAFTGALLARFGVERAVLVGHSMGGLVALQHALESPAGVRALVLVGTAARIEVPDEFVEQMRRVTEGKDRRMFRREIYSPASAPEVMRRGFMEDLKTDPRATLGDLLAARDFDARERLGEIRVPTLVIAGEDEVEGLRKAAEALESGIAGARRVEIPKAGHMLPIEQPQALADAIAGFLAEIDA